MRDAPRPALPADAPRVRVVTWNLHSSLGPAPRWRRPRAEVERDLRAVAAAVAGSAPRSSPVDLVGLNEVDFGATRSGNFDQAAFLADELERLTGERYEIVRNETWRRDVPGMRVRFGNALLSRHPVVDVACCLLDDGHACEAEQAATPDLPPLRVTGWLASMLSETRGVVRATVRLPGADVDVLVTHLEPFLKAEREAQAVHLRHRWVRPDRPTILMGDMNSVRPGPQHAGTVEALGAAVDRTWAALTSGTLRDALRSFAPDETFATYPARAPTRPIDWVLASEDFVPESARVLSGPASDHLGVAVGFGRLLPAASAAP
jgi:endonuclease/exonuclease/phosphatase family metal-dependent hydrolase